MLVAVQFFPIVIFVLYMRGIKLSVLGEPGKHYLGFTSFGAPVDGLRRGMLLVSIGARGPFERTVLYVIEHSDSSTLAVILNKPVRKMQSKNEGGLMLSVRSGGPLQQGLFVIHNVNGIPGAQRLLRGQPVFLSRSIDGSLEAFMSNGQDEASIVMVRGFASWGSHQLEGEVRGGAWGWVKPEHVRPDDVLEMNDEVLDLSWQRLVNAPYLQFFEG